MTTFSPNASRRLLSAIMFAIVSVFCPAAVSTDGSEAKSLSLSPTVEALADRYLESWIEFHPAAAGLYGVPQADHSRWPMIFPEELLAWQAVEEKILDDIGAQEINPQEQPGDWLVLAMLREQLEASRQMRVCREELWSVNHMDGWQVYLDRIAAAQPLATAEDRRAALKRWRSFGEYLAATRNNLELGLKLGYSAAQPVVQRMIAQLAHMDSGTPDKSPLRTLLGDRTPNDDYYQEMYRILGEQVLPALRAFRQFLQDDYLPQARTALTIYANRDGEACYAALLRSHTSLDTTADAIYALGKEAVAANREAVLRLGRKHYGTEDFAATLAAVADDPANHHESREDIIAAAEATVARARQQIEPFFHQIPDVPVVIRPIPAHLEGTGRSASYQRATGGNPGTYWIALQKPTEQRRGNTEITAVHEVWPGHHLQMAIAARFADLHPVLNLLGNSGYVEGWGRYAEALAEEAGIYQATAAAISRRAWPARGMMVDTGIHAFGWDRARAEAFIAESRIVPDSEVPALVDRIVATPGQLTAYDSGALTIFALRREAESALGDAFDIAAFHDALLAGGAVPLTQLELRMRNWIAQRLDPDLD
jgi:uncharacterized protein (DUF885 family)